LSGGVDGRAPPRGSWQSGAGPTRSWYLSGAVCPAALRGNGSVLLRSCLVLWMLRKKRSKRLKMRVRCVSGELRAEPDAGPHHLVSTDSSSSSGYSSSPCSPRTPRGCDSAFDRTRDVRRRRFTHRTLELSIPIGPETGWD